MKAAMKVAVFAIALLPSAVMLAEHPAASHQHATVLHDRSPRIRTKIVSVRTNR